MLLVQASVLSFGIANGLGKPVGSLSDDQIERSLKVCSYHSLPITWALAMDNGSHSARL